MVRVSVLNDALVSRVHVVTRSGREPRPAGGKEQENEHERREGNAEIIGEAGMRRKNKTGLA